MKKNLLTNPPSALRATSPTRGEDNSSHHQPRSPKLRLLARTMRRNLTLHEVKLWKRLKSKQLGVVFYRQYLITNKYIADFVCLEKKLIIEVDGSQHCDNPQDVKRTAELTKMGFQIIRFWNLEIDRNLASCVQVIEQKLKE